jgi:CSLREA domain-containing protein
MHIVDCSNRANRTCGPRAARSWLRRVAAIGGLTLAALGLAGLTAPLAHAATQTLTVTTFGDPATSDCPAAANPCSLREAITIANGDTNDIISLPAGSYTMAQGVLPSITASMSFVGASAPSTVINGTTGDNGPLFFITGGPA